MIEFIIGAVVGYALAQFVSVAKLRDWLASFRKDGVGEADE